MTASRLVRIGSPDTGMSIAAVFGVEWLVKGLYSLHNTAVEAWRSYLRRWSAEPERCAICDDELWRGDLVSCSNDGNRHWYCLNCATKTINAMITGDVAFAYDPRTTFPLCCYCPSDSEGPASMLNIHSFSSQIQRSWDRAVVARQLQGLGLPLLTCAHCGYVVVDEREADRQPQPSDPSKGVLGLRRRLTSVIASFVNPSTAKKPQRFHCPECDWRTCLPPDGCGNAFVSEEHKCRTDDLRLEIERAVDKSLIYRCLSCSASLVKDGGCNHCTCVCGAEYCHLCHASLGANNSSLWKTHFCGHFLEHGEGKCRQCSRCPLYSDRDDEHIRRRVEGEVTKRWKRRQVWNGLKSWVGLGSS
ncbi:hypothetical protein C8R45DRAFT_996167 [Mycena sanguinolenta]|nr:hypothetical protein C8R45DRAFT_996167 [Mycena sanguinolenta]